MEYKLSKLKTMLGEHYYFYKRKSNHVVLLIVLLLFTFSLNLFAQQKLNFSFKDVPLKTAITEIEKQSGYKFVFSASVVNVTKNVSGEFKNAVLDKVLQDLLTGSGISYTIQGKQIILANAEKKASATGKTKITGNVTDENGQPFSFLNVFDTSNPRLGVVTDDNGKYTIEVPSNTKSLSFSFMGYKPGIVNIGKGTVINYQMETDSENLEEVVIVGFGQQSKASVSAAVSSIKADEIIKSPVANVTNAIAGRVAGITTMQSSGQPGYDDATIIVRGKGTWNSSEPLYVIDGVERTKEIFATMDAGEIESFTVLKDAAATAVYGSKGANGVILITSKRGQEGKVAVNFNISTTLQQFTRYPNYLNSYESLKLYNEALMNDGNDPLYSQEDLEHYRTHDDPYRYPDTDWYKLLMKDVAPQFNASLNLRGGSRTVRYFISGSFMDQEGQLKTAQGRIYNPKFSYKRYRFSANLDAIITQDFTISVELSGSYSDRRDPNAQMDVFKYMNRMAPWYMPAINPDGSYAATAEYKDMNPMWMLNTKGSDQRNTTWITSSVKLNYDFNKWVKGLSVNARIAFDSSFYPAKYWTETQSTYQLISRSGRADRYISFLKPEFFAGSNGTWGTIERRLDGLANIIYNRKFGEHSLRLQGIANFSEKRLASAVTYNVASFIGRINYSYKNKYNIEANASYRGSENFAPGRRFGLFPSVSASWNVTSEKFMKRLTFITNLKLRGSYGLTGSDYAGTRFLYKDSKWVTGTSSSSYSYPYFGYNGGSSAGYVREPSLSNPLATWEKADQINIGADLSIWKDKITISYDRFFENRHDILQQSQSIPQILGIGLPNVNIGKAKRDGWELEVAYNQEINKDFGFYIKGNVSYVQNQVVFKDEPAAKDSWLKAEGKPIGQYFGYVVEGFFRNQEEIDNAPKQQVGSSPIPGDLRYMDYNGDGVVNEYDQVPIGYPSYPKYSFGLSIGANIKNFDFNILFQGAAQSSVFISDFLMYEFYNRGKVQDIHLGRWTPETAETATYPALHVGAISQNHVQNSFFIKDNPYLRLKSIEVAYSLSPTAARKIGMKGLRIYLSGVNLFTWDKLKVVDPETATNTSESVYPQARNFSLGLNFNF